jgi:hypothetical protein
MDKTGWVGPLAPLPRPRRPIPLCVRDHLAQFDVLECGAGHAAARTRAPYTASMGRPETVQPVVLMTANLRDRWAAA